MTYPEKVDLSILKGSPTYEGSVQDLFSFEDSGREYFLCRTSESGSVFDVGTIFSVPNSDIMRTVFRHILYTSMENPETWKAIGEDDIKTCYKDDEIVKDLLDGDLLAEFREKGMMTHHVGMVDHESGKIVQGEMPDPPTAMVVIEKFPVYKPARFSMWGRYGWDYHDYFQAGRKVISLEHVFRLGSPGGSSLLKRFDRAKPEGADAVKKFLQDVGLEEEPVEWDMFGNMIYDCTTKYEPSDRQLSWQETIHLSGVSGELFEKVAKTLVFSTIYAKKFFAQLGFELWDLKWECAVDGGDIIVVDTLDPDSVRVTGTVDYEGREVYIHFNKQSIRDYYRLCRTEWYDSVNEAKKLARTDPKGRDFMAVYREKVEAGEFPDIPEYDPVFGKIQSRKYGVMVDPLTGAMSWEDAKKEARDLMLQEIEYYKERGKLDQFLKMNAK